MVSLNYLVFRVRWNRSFEIFVRCQDESFLADRFCFSFSLAFLPNFVQSSGRKWSGLDVNCSLLSLSPDHMYPSGSFSSNRVNCVKLVQGSDKSREPSIIPIIIGAFLLLDIQILMYFWKFQCMARYGPQGSAGGSARNKRWMGRSGGQREWRTQGRRRPAHFMRGWDDMRNTLEPGDVVCNSWMCWRKQNKTRQTKGLNTCSCQK